MEFKELKKMLSQQLEQKLILMNLIAEFENMGRRYEDVEGDEIEYNKEVLKLLDPYKIFSFSCVETGFMAQLVGIRAAIAYEVVKTPMDTNKIEAMMSEINEIGERLLHMQKVMQEAADKVDASMYV